VNRPDAGFISCRLKIFKDKVEPKQSFLNKVRNNLDKLFKPSVKISNFDYLFGFNTYLVGSCFKRELALSLGGFNADLFPSADYYFVVKFKRVYNNIYFLKKKNYLYRIFINESLNKVTARKFLIYDYYFYNFFISVNDYKFKNFLKFLNKQYVINRLITQRKAYGINLDLFSILNELKIKKYHNLLLLRMISGIVFKTISMYRAIVKF
jgi:hypothetical protein